jgi:hypothetical protein
LKPIYTTSLPSFQASTTTCLLGQCHLICARNSRASPLKNFFQKWVTTDASQALLHGPSILGGIGLRHLFSEQGTEKNAFALRMLRIDQPASRILKIQLAWGQRVAGFQAPLLVNPTASIPHLSEELWVTTFREFLRESEISIFIPSIKCRPFKCVHDQFKMEIASFLNYSRASMIRLNRCRIYLKAETLADIVTYNGLHIDIDAFECNPKGVFTSPEKWPIQTRPGHKICHIDSINS